MERDQVHYLLGVMRLTQGDEILLFNGLDGEWRAVIADAHKRGGTLACVEQTRPLQRPPDLWLMFAPIKKSRTDFIVEKAAEMGAARICPVITDHSNTHRIQRDRLQTHAVEAAEQCGGTYVPEVEELSKLSARLDRWDSDRQILFCDEALIGRATALTMAADQKHPWAILIGPEGGFSDAERVRLRTLPFAHPVSLGPRVLRADTAAVAAMALWQQHLGDWQ
jgi:16S rRNA (uracil1498-N3)-methyltransferase